MPTSVAEKGQNNSPFDPVYSVGGSLTQKKIGQSSLMLLHIKINIYTFIRFIQISKSIKCLLSHFPINYIFLVIIGDEVLLYYTTLVVNTDD